MPEDNQNSNLDSFLDKRIRQSLQSHTSGDFIYEMNKRITLEKEFEKEDVKTYRLVKYIIGGFVSLLIGFSFLFTFILTTNENNKDVSFINGIIVRFSDAIENISIFTTQNLGFSFDVQTGAILLAVTACIFLYSFADRIIFKKLSK